MTPVGEPPFRIGHGYDVHAFSEDPSRSLLLGGVVIPGAPGLEGHSDGDVVLHAVADALLGAVALGDLGRVVGVDDPATAGVASSVLLQRAWEPVQRAGWALGNVDVTVVAARPRLSAHSDGMAASVARVLGVPPTCVSCKATTTDGLGALGRGEGIAAAAVALVVRRA